MLYYKACISSSQDIHSLFYCTVQVMWWGKKNDGDLKELWRGIGYARKDAILWCHESKLTESGLRHP